MIVEFLTRIFNTIDYLTWGWALIPFLVVLGIFITLFTGFVQFEFFTRMFRVLRSSDEQGEPHQVSARQALFLSVGGRVGGGNIAGVAVAVTLGGPGAVFWMWAIALIGMGTSLVECTLAQIYKRKQADGAYVGGPAAYIRYGLGQKYRWLSILFSICLMASFALGFNAFQSNTVAGAAQSSLGIDRMYTGIFLAIVTSFIVFGGIRRITKVCDVMVPIMAITYIGFALLVLVWNISDLPRVLYMIVANAFGWEEAVSGGVGMAIAQGLRRGLFSNEAGLGSAPNVAATAYVKHPISQGITQSLSVFIDTMIVCSATAFMILLSTEYVPGAKIDGIVLVQNAMVSYFGHWAQYFLTFSILLFAYSTIIYNYYLGEVAMSELSNKPAAMHVLRVVIIGIVFLGAVAPGASAVFFFADPVMGLLAIINLVVITMLLPTAMRVLHDYRMQLKAGVNTPIFNPHEFADLDIDATAWEAKKSSAGPAGRSAR